MMLTTKGRYAVMAIVDIASASRFLEKGKAVSLADIAARQEITLPYLEQIFCRLKNNGIVRSMRGPGGGYVLAKEADQITISEIIAASDEQMKMTRCGSSHKTENACLGSGKCSTHDLWDGLSRHIEDYLDNVTVADVVNKKIKASLQGANGDVAIPLTKIATASLRPRNDGVMA